jgi:hypothetical protein
MDETEAVRNRVRESFIEIAAASPPVHVTDGLFLNPHILDTEETGALFAALAKDAESLTAEALYFPGEKAHAILSFQRVMPDGSYAPVNFVQEVWGQVVAGAVAMMPEANREDLLHHANVSLSESRGDFFHHANALFSNSTGVMRIFVTGEYIHTLAFLREKGLLGNDRDGSPPDAIQGIHIQRYDVNSFRYPTQPLFFRAYTTWFDNDLPSWEVARGEWDEILRLARTHHAVVEGGYTVKVLTADESGNKQWTMLFLPEGDAPGYVKREFGA